VRTSRVWGKPHSPKESVAREANLLNCFNWEFLYGPVRSRFTTARKRLTTSGQQVAESGDCRTDGSRFTFATQTRQSSKITLPDRPDECNFATGRTAATISQGLLDFPNLMRLSTHHSRVGRRALVCKPLQSASLRRCRGKRNDC